MADQRRRALHSRLESHRRHAFTLVELLVVIGVIAILIAILLPALLKARRSANAVVCMNNLRMIGLGMAGYELEYNGAIPWEGYAEGDRPIRHLGPWSEPSVWFNAPLQWMGLPTYDQMQRADPGIPLPKSGDQGLFVCPEAGPAVAGTVDDQVIDGCFMLWGLDDLGNYERRKTYWCYGYNTKLDGGVEDRNVDYRVTLRRNRFRHSSETILLVEKLMRPKEFDPPFPTEVGQQEVSWREFTTRHNKGGYILFLDNHVGFFTRREVLSAPRAPFDYNQPGMLIWDPRGIGSF